MYRHFLILTIINTICVLSAPTETQQPQNTVYDYSKYGTVYDQRQNGSENYKINVDGVVVVWAAPETALSATALLEAALLEGEYPDLEEILNPQKPHKPENFLVVSPEKPSSSTTTNVPPSLATEINAQEVQKGTGRHDIVKRKYIIPAFIRPFLAKRRL